MTTTTRYLYDNEDIIAEYDANGNLITKYIHGLGIDEPLAMEKNSSTYYYHADGLGSVVALSDGAGTVVQKYEYDSFGNIKSVLDPNFIQPYTFTGREYDSETGLLFYRARILDSKTGTFTTKDPIGFSAGDTNLYRYVFNSPINYVDPYGLYVWPYSWKGWAGVTLGLTGVSLVGITRNPAGVVVFVAGAVFTIWDVIEGPQEAIEDVEKKLKPVEKAIDELKKEIENQEKDKCPNKGDKK